jgi:hypothetical protein
LSDDHKIGGHVLACAFQGNLLHFDECTTAVIHVPQSSEFDNFDTRDVSKDDVDNIERQRTQIGRP